MKNETSSALLIIDMERGFTDPASVHCIRTAEATVPAIAGAAAYARAHGIPVIYVKREYRASGCDVELTRFSQWLSGGKAMQPGSKGECSSEVTPGLEPQKNDIVLTKPRWSAFFGTELDLILRRLGVRTVILSGTTTPNCIRTTCYDAVALEYNAVVLEDCCSSQTEEIQRANLSDMKNIGAKIMSSSEFISYYADIPQTDGMEAPRSYFYQHPENG